MTGHWRVFYFGILSFCQDVPFNPMLNAGAMMSAGLILQLIQPKYAKQNKSIKIDKLIK